jgi:hypothetical protein
MYLFVGWFCKLIAFSFLFKIFFFSVFGNCVVKISSFFVVVVGALESQHSSSTIQPLEKEVDAG